MFTLKELAESYIHEHGSKSKKKKLDQTKLNILYGKALTSILIIFYSLINILFYYFKAACKKKFLRTNHEQRNIDKLMTDVKVIIKHKCCDSKKVLKNRQPLSIIEQNSGYAYDDYDFTG